MSRDAAIVCAGSMGSSVAAARSLGRAGIPVVCVAFDRHDPLLQTRYADETHVITGPHDDFDAFRSELATVAAETGTHTFVPLNEYGVYTATRYANYFAGSLSLPLPDWDTVARVWDRQRLLALADRIGVPIPETEPLSRWNAWEEPCIVKSRYSILERGGRLVYPGVEFVAPDERPDVETVVDRMFHEPLVQRYVDNGTEFGFFAVYDHGEPVATFQHRRVRSTSYAGGASAHRQAVRDDTVERLGRRILDELSWHGPAMVEFRRNDTTGAYKLMEINPRLWGSLALSVAAGVDFPVVYYRLSHGETPAPNEGYDETTTASYLRAELQHLGSVLFDSYPPYVSKPSVRATLASQLRSVPRAHFDVLSLTDPKPFLWDYLAAFERLRARD